MSFLKKQFKKSNRGIILALILIIGVVIYTIVDNHNFKAEKPEIEQVITEFVTQMGEFNVTPKELIGKTELSDEDTATYEDSWNEYVKKYWVYKKENTNSIYWYCYVSDFRSLYSLHISNSESEYVEACTMEARNIRISKAGPNCATATFEIHAVVQSTPNADIITPVFNEGVGWYVEDEEQTIEKYKLEGEFTLTLERTADGWKIFKSDGYMTSFSLIN